MEGQTGVGVSKERVFMRKCAAENFENPFFIIGKFQSNMNLFFHLFIVWLTIRISSIHD